MASYLDRIFADATLSENYNSQAYLNLLEALKIADETITRRIFATKGQWTKTKLNEIKALINHEIGQAYGGLFAGIADEAVEMANVSYGLMIGSLGTLLPIASMNEIANSKRLIQGYEFKELFDLTGENHARQLRREVAAGVSQGLTAEQIVNLYNIKSDSLSKGQITSNLRTAIFEAKRAGRDKAYEKLEKSGVIVGYEYVSTLDSNTTIWCREHDGRFYKTREEINKDLNHHFNCRADRVARTQNEIDRSRASETGAVDDTNYEKWYLSQPKDFQGKTLTNRQYELFLKGKYKVKSLADITKKQSLESIKSGLKQYL